MQEKKLRAQVADLATRLEQVSSRIEQYVVRLAHLGETLATVVDIFGEDRVVEHMGELRLRRKEAHEKELQESVAKMVELGLASATEVITDHSFIVADEVGPKGSVRVQFEMKRFDAAGQAMYLGKKAGDEITAPDERTKVIIREVYIIDAAKVRQYRLKEQQEKLAKATEAAEATQPAADTKAA